MGAYLRAEAHEEQGELVEVRRVAFEQEREALDVAVGGDFDREVLLEHLAAVHDRFDDQLQGIHECVSEHVQYSACGCVRRRSRAC